MPITVPAHQAVVLPLKLAWPRRVDATAMCIGSAAPDLGYVLGGGGQTHSVFGLVVFAIPFTLIACQLLRWRAAQGVFGNFPDAGPFRLHSYRVLVERRPGAGVTFISAVVGTVSHVVVDSFTHKWRWGANWLGLNETLFTVPWRGEVSGARVLQYLGHTVGSFVGVLLFAYIGREHLLERWYGIDAVRSARSFELSTRDRVVFWSTTTGVTLVSTAIGMGAGANVVFAFLPAVTIGLLVAGCVRRTSGRPVQVST